MRSLELFGAVLRKSPNNGSPVFSCSEGFVLDSGGAWAFSAVEEFFREKRLSGNALNSTFHKSWKRVRDASREELAIEQLRHYWSTYGTNFEGVVYIPDEVLEVPDTKLAFLSVQSLTESQLIEKCLGLLESGIALKEETVETVLDLLVGELGYAFSGQEEIRNKEAMIKIADLCGVLPKHTIDVFRYVVYRCTGSTLLIKNAESIEAIKSSDFQPASIFSQHGLAKMATIFHRFKPLFLAMKPKCPGVINKISKLAKKHHVPMEQNPLNLVTQRQLELSDESIVDQATPFAVFRAMAACAHRLELPDAYTYRIRNGKSWTKDAKGKSKSVASVNYGLLRIYVAHRFKMSGTTVLLPKNVEYALPTSEKMFVGNIPTGTSFYGKRLAAGVYWENDWGANDIDVSAISASGGKIGWNSAYSRAGLIYSGDMTDASNGAVEYLHVSDGFEDPYLVLSNVYRGEPTCGYKIVVGKGSKVSRPFMMDPNKVLVDVRCESVQRQTVLGMLIPEGKKQRFVLLNFGAGSVQVANPKVSREAIKALYQQWRAPLSLRRLLLDLGATVVTDPSEDVDVDLSLSTLSRDSFTALFR